MTKPSKSSLDISPESEPAQELNRRAAPSVEAHHRVNGPNTGRNSGGRRIKKGGMEFNFFETIKKK